MKKIILSLGILIIIFASNAYSDGLSYQDKTFTALVANVRLLAELTAQGKKYSDKVSVTVPSVIFDKPIVIDDVRTVNKSYGPEIDILIKFLKANMEGTKEEVISFWHPSDKQEITQMVSDPQMFEENRVYFKQNPGVTIIGLIKQKSTRSILVNKDFMVFGINLKQSEGKLYFTNAPDNDLELAIIEASFM